ncbi:hypothetical protein FZC66_17955 [Priestia megaterium]|nr:hypothetical protein FZC66_17955 [Priestia megaterium]
MNNRALIEQVVAEVLKSFSMSAGEHAEKPALLVVNAQESMNPSQLKALESKWKIIYPDSNKENWPATTKAALFLDATQDLFVKGAIGIADTPESQLLAQSLAAGMSVSLIPSPSLEKIILNEKQEIANKSYVSHLLTYKKTLESFGVKIESFAAFLNVNSSEKQISFTERVLTQQHVKLWNDEKITISNKTIITPLARDTARELGKLICVIESKGVDAL